MNHLMLGLETLGKKPSAPILTIGAVLFNPHSGELGEQFYTAPPAPAVPEGWKMVPVEPTEEMLRAAFREASVYSPAAYRAMLGAAPEGGNG